MTKKRENGFMALTSVLILGAIVVILVISLFHSALTDYSISTVFESGQQADFLADFCLREGVLKLQENINYLGDEDISLDDATCSILSVDNIDDKTKEIKSLGRSGEQPHLSRASQRIRYIIEPGQDGWVLAGEEGKDWENVEIVGSSLRLAAAEPTLIEENFAEYSSINNLEITEDGSLVLAMAVPTCSDGIDNDGDLFIDYPDDPDCSSPVDAEDEYNGPELKANGATCTDGSECLSTFCSIDGVCCNNSCDTEPECQTCGIYSSNGLGNCGHVNSSGQDPRGDCDQGSDFNNGCRSNYCSGTDYSCGVRTSGDGGCPLCATCSDSDEGCEFHEENTYDNGCSQCRACTGSEYGSCTKVITFGVYQEYGCGTCCMDGVCQSSNILCPT